MAVSDTVICVPTRRPPPILTFEHYEPPLNMDVILMCDPEVYEKHLEAYGDNPQFHVLKGERGIGPQIHLCYLRSFELGASLWVKLDDDLADKTYVHKEGHYPALEEVIFEMECCLKETKTTHAGLGNGSNRFWMGTGYKRTWGLIHGGTNIAVTTNEPWQFIDVRLRRAGDVYRSCAHRELDGAVGRVAHIGFDKSKSTITAGQTSIDLTMDEILANRDFILKAFPGFVTCEGVRYVDNGTKPILNWRMRRDPGFTS